MKKFFYHESTKGRKHERKEKFRAFNISCFRDQSFGVPAFSG
jgi:hypothetical protein